MAVKYHLSGTVQSVLVGKNPDSMITTSLDQVYVDLAGFEGDLHAGFTRKADGRTPYYPRGIEIRNDRQVTIVSTEELTEITIALNLPEVLPEWLGANLLFSGIPRLTQLPPNTRLVFGNGVVLVVQAENLPCTGPGEVLAAHFRRPELENLFPRVAMGLRGLVACVEKPGWLKVGDSVQAKVPAQVIYDPTG